jgi:general secretion pathway protein L
LLPVDSQRIKSNTTRQLNIFLTVVMLLLLAATISVPILQKQKLIRELEPQVEQALAAAKKSSEIRQQVQQLVDASSHLERKKRTEPLVVRVFDEITRVLPDHTWINRLDISAREIQLQGQSSSSAALIPLLEKSPLLEEVRFRSPVMRTPTTGEERFHLSAELVRVENE